MLPDLASKRLLIGYRRLNLRVWVARFFDPEQLSRNFQGPVVATSRRTTQCNQKPQIRPSALFRRAKNELLKQAEGHMSGAVNGEILKEQSRAAIRLGIVEGWNGGRGQIATEA